MRIAEGEHSGWRSSFLRERLLIMFAAATRRRGASGCRRTMQLTRTGQAAKHRAARGCSPAAATRRRISRPPVPTASRSAFLMASTSIGRWRSGLVVIWQMSCKIHSIVDRNPLAGGVTSEAAHSGLHLEPEEPHFPRARLARGSRIETPRKLQNFARTFLRSPTSIQYAIT